MIIEKLFIWFINGSLDGMKYLAKIKVNCCYARKINGKWLEIVYHPFTGYFHYLYDNKRVSYKKANLIVRNRNEA